MIIISITSGPSVKENHCECFVTEAMAPKNKRKRTEEAAEAPSASDERAACPRPVAHEAAWKKAVHFARMSVEKKRVVENAVAECGPESTLDDIVAVARRAAATVPKPRSVPKALKLEVWTNHFGDSAAQGSCKVCAKTVHIMDCQIGHKTSRCNGGGDEPSNLVVLCGACNQSQGTDDLDVFLARLGREGRERQRDAIIKFLLTNPAKRLKMVPILVTHALTTQREMLEEAQKGGPITEKMLETLRRWGFHDAGEMKDTAPSMVRSNTRGCSLVLEKPAEQRGSPKLAPSIIQPKAHNFFPLMLPSSSAEQSSVKRFF